MTIWKKFYKMIIYLIIYIIKKKKQTKKFLTKQLNKKITFFAHLGVLIVLLRGDMVARPWPLFKYF